MKAPHSAPNRRPSQFQAGAGRGELPLWAVLVVACGVLVLGVGGSNSGSALANDSGVEDAFLGSIPPAIEPGALDGDHGNESSVASMFDLVGVDRAREALSAHGELGEIAEGAWVSASGPPAANDGAHTLLAVENSSLESIERLIAGGAESEASQPRRLGRDKVGLHEEGSYRRGVRHGAWKSWRDDGTLRTAGDYVDGLREGAWESYSQSGVLLSELHYEAGSRHGDWLVYAEDGSILEQGQYSENAASGRWTTYYSGGQIRERGLFVNGLREGHWEFYDDLGLPTLEAGEYRAGIKVQ